MQAFLFENDVSKALAGITDPKTYEKQKKEWLSAVQFSVDQSRSFNCTSCTHRAPRAIWPPFADAKELDKVSKDLAALKAVDLVRNELVCFYTRQTFQEDVLGVGVTFSKNVRTGEIKSIQSPLDLVSLRAFMNHDLRLSAANEKFTHWLPLFLNAEHGKKAMHLAKRALSIICTGTNKNFKPDQVLNVIPRLMSTMVVEVMSGKAHASIKALRGYCLFHRLLLEFVKEFPELREFCNEQVGKFISDEKSRHKDVVPNLGEMLCYLAVSNKYSWKDVKDAYLEESVVRNVFWILNRYPELEQESHPEVTLADRLKYSFEVSKVSQKLCSFHQWFLDNVAHPSGMTPDEISKRYDDNYGRPSNESEDQFLTVVDKINKIASYKDFYTIINKQISEEEIAKQLVAATKKSKEKGYHGTTLSVLTPEEFAKENKAVDLSKLVTAEKSLLDNEAMWQEMANKRWGFTSLPDYLQNTTAPWRKLYLQNNVQDLVAKLNESQDFKTFHDTLDLSAEIPRLELVTFNPANLTSKFHFLTSLLVKLKNLSTLIIRKGEFGLGVKGFKALVKGLGMNPGCLKTLILEGCDLDARSIEELTKSKLVSSNLQTLNLVGNPLSDQGAEMLATFLLRHQNLPHLTELDVTDCRIGERGAKALAEAILVKKELTNLKIMKNNFNSGLTDVMKSLSYNPTVKSVDAGRMTGSFNDAGRDSLGKLVKLSISLEELNLWRVTAVANLDAQVFNELKENSTLKILDISETGFNRMELFGIAYTKNTTLSKLVLAGNGINCTSIFNMIEELKKAKPLKEEKGGKSPVAPKDDSLSLSEEIRKFNITLPLTYLDFNKNNFGYAVKPKHKSVIGELMMYAKNLTFLNLSCCGLEKDNMVSIGEALRENTSIIELNLRKNRIGKFGLKPLIAGLKENKTLQKLDVSGNDLGVLGAASLAAILEGNTGLKEVNLFSNFIEIEGCELICAALAKNKTLTSLDMGLNRIRVRGGTAVVKMLSNNTTLTRVALKHNRLTDKLGMAIAAAIVNNKNCAIKNLSLAGNYLSTIIRSEISSMLTLAARGIVFDLSKIVEFKDPERQERTVYITPLPCNVTETMIKKLFYENKCGVCLNVNIYKHKTKKDKNKVKYAFVEFLHPDSIALALRLPAKKLNRIAGEPISIMRAGIQQNVQEDDSKSSNNNRSERGNAGRGRGGFRGRGAPRGGRGGRGAPRGRGRR